MLYHRYIIYPLFLAFASIVNAGTFDLVYDDFANSSLDAKWSLIGVDAGESVNASGSCLNFAQVLDTAGVKCRFGGFNMFLRFSADVFSPSGASAGQEAVISFSDTSDRVPIDMRIINESGVNKLKVRKRYSSGMVVLDNVADLAANTWHRIDFEVYVKGTQASQSCYFSVALQGEYLRSNLLSYPHAYPMIMDTNNGYNVEGVMDTLAINSSISGIKFDNIQVSINYMPFRIKGDIDRNGTTDFKDFAILAQSWLNDEMDL